MEGGGRKRFLARLSLVHLSYVAAPALICSVCELCAQDGPAILEFSSSLLSRACLGKPSSCMPRKRLPIAFCFLCAHLDDTKRCIRIGRLRYDRPSLTPAGHLLAQEACVACGSGSGSGSGSGKKESKKETRFFVSSLRLPIETVRLLPRQAQGKHQIVRNQNGGWVGGIGEKEQLRGVSLFSFLFFSPEPSGASLVATVVPAETHFCQWFSYVCPEPVLANVQLFDVCNGIIAKKLFPHRHPRRDCSRPGTCTHTHRARESSRVSSADSFIGGGQQRRPAVDRFITRSIL